MRFSLFRGKKKSSAPPRLILFLLSMVLIAYHFLVYLTSRRTIIGIENFKKLEADGQPFCGAVWHGNFFNVLLIGKYFYKKRRATLTSRSPYGALLTPYLNFINLDVIRGSSTGTAGNKPTNPQKGGREAIYKMISLLNQGTSTLMVADISPGPGYESGIGVVWLASHSNSPILPLAAASSRYKLFFKAWDKFQLPLPFSRRVHVIGKPLYVPSDLSREELEEYRLLLTQKINEYFDQAYAELGLETPRTKKA